MVLNETKTSVFIIDGIDSTIKIPQGQSKNEKNEAADFETAVAATGFGKFNLLLMLVGIPSFMATSIETSTMSYVLPIAQCDLNLTLENKGILNAITYIGMLPSAFIWGYLADTIGRKKPLSFALLFNGLFVILCGFSQHYYMLLVAKFITGLMINGSFATAIAYTNEFHAVKQRTYIPIIQGVISSIALILMPFVGWITFTDKINISVIDDAVTLKSWNIFFFIWSLPSLIAGVIYLLLPESPKYLMSMGRYDDALQIFKKVYCLNSGKSADTYPIKYLLDETIDARKEECKQYADRSTMQALKEGWRQILPLFHKEYLSKICLVFTIQFGIMASVNTLRMWLPEIFTAINDYHTLNPTDENPQICTVLETMTSSPSNSTLNETCFVNYNNSSVYINNVIIASVSMISYFACAIVIKKIGKRSVLVLTELCAGLSILLLYYTTSDTMVVVLTSIFISASLTGVTMIISITVEVFPTTLRTMTLSFSMMLGRCGAMIGNLIFPVLLVSGCLPPFLATGILSIISGILSCFLPKTDTKALE